MALVVILLTCFALLGGATAGTETCDLSPTTGQDEFAFEPTKLTDGEFYLSFKVVATTDFKIVLSSKEVVDEQAYVITIQVNSGLTILQRGDTVLKTHERKDGAGSPVPELQCPTRYMPGYWMCFKMNFLKFGREEESIHYFNYTFNAEESFEPNYIGYATSGENVAFFGSFVYSPTCTDESPTSGHTEINTTPRQQRGCPDISCTCTWGHVKDQNGCSTCDCTDSPCTPPKCEIICQHGLQRDDQGCEVCSCQEGPCDSGPCQNDGYCYGVGADAYKCNCPEGFNGDHCETDTGKPVIICPPDVTKQTDPGKPTATVTHNPTAYDNSNIPPTVTCSPKTPNLAVGPHTIQCTATDGSDNTSSDTYVVTVEDKEVPTLECPIPMEVSTDKGKAFASQVYTTPQSKDNADPQPTVTCTPDDQAEFTSGLTTVTCTATDDYGNENKCTFDVTVKDTEPPVFNVDPNIVVDADDGTTTTTVTYDVPEATDNVDGTVPVTCTPKSGTVFNLGSANVTCTATDSSNNELTAVITVTVRDASPPEMTCPEDMTVNMDPGKSESSVEYQVPKATDNSGPDPPTTCQPPSGSVFPAGSTPVTCTATDSSDNTCTCKFNVIVVDTQPPVLTFKEEITFVTDEGQNFATLNFAPPTAEDNYDEEVSVTCNPPPGTQVAVGDSQMTCSSTDKAGNKAACTINIKVKDNEKPKFQCPHPMTDMPLDDGGDTLTLAYTIPTAEDNVDESRPATCSPAPGTKVKIGSNIVICSSEDAAGNAHECTFSVDVKDTEKPKFQNVPEDSTVPMDKGKSTTTLTYVPPTATDNLTPQPKVVCSPLPGAEIGAGENLVTCTATDNSDNEATVTFTVTVEDKQGPNMECPLDMTEPLDKGVAYATVAFEPKVSDNADPSPSYTCDPVSGTQFPLKTTAVTCTATDNKQNTNACGFNVIVEDNQGPTIKCPVPMPYATDPGSSTTTVNYELPETSDNSGKKPSLTCTPDTGTVFSVGNTTVSCTARDGSGNGNKCDFYIVVQDKEKPVFETDPPNVEKPTDPGRPVATVEYDTPTANDNVDPDVTVICDPASGTEFPIGSSPVSCRAEDDAGNTEIRTFEVTVNDKEKPTLDCPKTMPAVNVGIDKDRKVVNYEMVPANDNSGSTEPVACAPAPGSEFPIGSTSVNCSTSDKAGNFQSCTLTINVKDTQKPDVTCPASKTMPMESGQNYAAADYDLPTATDNSKTMVRIDCTPLKGAKLLGGPNTVTCTATDKYENQQNCTFTITVEDKEAPTFTSPAPAPEGKTSTDSPFATVTFDTPTAKDNVDPEITPTCQPVSGSQFAVGDNQVICSAVDVVGNKRQMPFVVKVTDGSPPNINCPLPMNDISTITDTDYAEVTYALPMATDAVDANPTVTCEPPSQSQFKMGRTAVVCTATDSSQNSAKCTFDVIVKDEQKPSVTCPEPMALGMVTGEQYALVDFVKPTATDNSNGAVDVTCNPSNGDRISERENTVICTAIDGSSNKQTCSFTISVEDREDPTLTCPDSMTRPTDPRESFATVDFAKPVATDIADPNPRVECDHEPAGSHYQLGKSTVTCTATDNSGNTCQCTFDVTVEDKEPPQFPIPPSSTVPLDEGEKFATLQYDVPTATDNVDQSPTVTCTPASNAQIPVGRQTIECSSTDKAGNTKKKVFTTTAEDKVPPTLNIPEDISKDTDPDKAVTTVPFEVTAQDNVDPEPQVSCTRQQGEFSVGSTLVSCTATDKYGNKATDSFNVIVSDKQPPSFIVPDPISKPTDEGTDETQVFFEKPSGKDNVDGYVEVTCSPASGSMFKTGESTVTCSATDNSGNTKEETFTVKITDDQPPRFDTPTPISVTLKEGEPNTPVDYTIPVGTDNVDGEVPVSCEPQPGSTFNVGETTVTCTAEDSSKNTKTDTFTVTVIDKEPPKFNTPDSITKILDKGESTTPVDYEQPTGTDNVDGPVTVTCSKPSGTMFGVGSEKISCTSTDSSDNTRTETFTVTVKDEEAPVMQCSSGTIARFEAGVTSGVVNYETPTAVDNVDGSVDVSCKPASGSEFQVGSSQITCTTTDSSSNNNQCSFDIIVTAPCEFGTAAADFNKYPSCTHPLTPTDHNEVCVHLKEFNRYDVFMSLWNQKSGEALQDHMIDLTIVNEQVMIECTNCGIETKYLKCPGFENGDTELCIIRKPEQIVFSVPSTGNEVTVPQNVWSTTYVGYASSMSGEWQVDEYFVSENHSRRKRSVAVEEETGAQGKELGE